MKNSPTTETTASATNFNTVVIKTEVQIVLDVLGVGEPGDG
jgi:hypothetical protein